MLFVGQRSKGTIDDRIQLSLSNRIFTAGNSGERFDHEGNLSWMVKFALDMKRRGHERGNILSETCRVSGKIAYRRRPQNCSELHPVEHPVELMHVFFNEVSPFSVVKIDDKDAPAVQNITAVEGRHSKVPLGVSRS